MIQEVMDAQYPLEDALDRAFERKSKIFLIAGGIQFKCFVMGIEVSAPTQHHQRLLVELIATGKPVKKKKRVR
jgi:hypothetical protein